MRLSLKQASHAAVEWIRMQKNLGIPLVFREMWDTADLSLGNFSYIAGCRTYTSLRQAPLPGDISRTVITKWRDNHEKANYFHRDCSVRTHWARNAGVLLG